MSPINAGQLLVERSRFSTCPSSDPPAWEAGFMTRHSRRDFLRTACLQTAALSGFASANWLLPDSALAQVTGERPRRDDSVKVLNPRARVPGLVDHRRLDLPGEPGPLRHAPVRPDLAGSGRLPEAVEDLAARDPRRLRPQVRRVVRRARRQGQVLDRSLSGLRRLARPLPARLVPARNCAKASTWSAN